MNRIWEFILRSCKVKQGPWLANVQAAFFIFVLLSLAGCTVEENGLHNNQVTLHVFAAASLNEPFSEISQAFEVENPGVRVIFNFAGSQQLAQQILQGAPVDVFASANQKQMSVLIQAGEALADRVQTFASNRLVMIYPLDGMPRPVDLQVLSGKDTRLVLAAPEVPAGQYTQEFLEKASQEAAFGVDFKEAVIENVVSYEDNVKAVLSKVALGEADAGIVYASDVSGENAQRVGIIEIPEVLNVLATYPIAVTKASENPEMARAFVNYVLSPAGQAVLEKYNFIRTDRP